MVARPTGPIPERTDQRRRRNKPADGAVVESSPGARVVEVPEVDESWHRMAVDWYRSLAESGQARFYEPSDWSTARVWAEILSRQLNAGTKMSSMMIAAWSSASAELLTTEGARRRGRLELERAEPDREAEAAKVTALDRYRRVAGAAG